MFVDDNFYLTISPTSYRPIWEAASTVSQGYSKRHADLSQHRLEGFDVNLASDCNCASVYYLLKDLEVTSKDAPCGSFSGITVNDYLLPEVADIKGDRDFTARQCLLEVEQTAGSMSTGSDRSFLGTKLIFQILDG